MPRNKVAWRRLVFVVLIIASLAVLTVSFRETESGPVHSVQQGVAGLLSPMQSWGSRIAQPFQDGYNWLTTLWSAHKDAERLSEQVQVLQGQVIALEEQAEENQRLKGLLDLKDKGTFPTGTQFVVARVIAKAPNKWLEWVEIDKGSADGIKVDQAVVGSTPLAGETLAGKGLVGHVYEVTAHSAKVLLITDSDSNVAAKIQGSRAEGIVQGGGALKSNLSMNLVDRDISVDPKLVVVTSGYGGLTTGASGIYPPDIPIGIVGSVGEQGVNPFRSIEVQPLVDFRVLEEVMVLIVPEDTEETQSTSTTSTTLGAFGTTTTTTGFPATTTTSGVTTTTTTNGASTTTTTE
jgi:rod shape-determining protein MreC